MSAASASAEASRPRVITRYEAPATDNVDPNASAWPGSMRPLGIARRAVRRIFASNGYSIQ